MIRGLSLLMSAMLLHLHALNKEVRDVKHKKQIPFLIELDGHGMYFQK